MQQIRTPDGVIHQFPDEATPDQISEALGSGGGAAPAAPAPGNQDADMEKMLQSVTGQPGPAGPAAPAANDTTMLGAHYRGPRAAEAAPPADAGPPANYSDVIPGGLTPEQMNRLSAFDRWTLDQQRPGLMDKAIHGITFGLTDEASGLAYGLHNLLRGTGTFSEGWDQGREAEKARLAEVDKAHPILGPTAEIAGGVLGAAPARGVQAVAEAPRLLARVGQGMKQGAMLGALQGAGNSEGGIADRLWGTAAGAGTGAAVGSVVPVVTSAAGKAWSGLKSLFTDEASRTANDLMAKAAANMTQPQIDAAQQLVRQAARMGQNLTFAEAAQQVTGGANKALTDLQRVVENSTGGERLTAAMAERPGQAATAAGDLATAVRGGPAQTDLELQGLPGRLADRGNQAIRRLEQSRTQAVEPFYNAVDAARPMPSSPENLQQWRELLDRPAVGDAFRRAQVATSNAGEAPMTFLRVNPDTNQLELDHLPSGAEIDSMKKAMDRIISGTETPTGKVLDPNNVMAAKNALVDLADQSLPTYAEGRAMYRAMTPNVEQQSAGPLGKIAQDAATPESQFTQQMQALLPDAPKVTDPDSVRRVIRQLQGGRATYRPGGGRRVLDPTARQAIGQYIGSKFDEIAQGFKSAPTQQSAGAGFWANMAGNSSQAANLNAAVEEAAGPDVADGMRNLFRVFEAQGYRQPAGSQTSFNQMIRDAMAGNGLTAVDAMVAAKTGGASLIPKVADAIGKNNAASRAADVTSRLSDLLLNPEMATQWRQLGRLDPNSPQAGKLVRTLLQRLGTTAPLAVQGQ